MKLTTAILFIFCLQVSARVSSQTITYKGRDVKPAEVFAVIKKQTGFTVFGNEALLRSLPPVSIDAQNMPLPVFLSTMLAGQSVRYSIRKRTIILSTASTAPSTGIPLPKAVLQEQRIELRGRVTDTAGASLPGASVKIMGADIGVTANDEGEFVIHAKEGDVLIVSFLGFAPQNIALTADVLRRQPVVVRMRVNAQELEGVGVTVSTGYQKIPRERATGSFVQVSNKELNRRVGTSVIELLDGSANGIQFDKRTRNQRFNIRGYNSFTFTQPLVVVDNFPYYGNVNDLDPNDIESITLLMDAAAASIWGARAGNGVVVITRKKSAIGQPFRVDFNSNITVQEATDLYYKKNMTVPQLMEIERWLFDKGHYNARLTNPNKKTIILSPQVQLLDKLRKNEITREEVDAQISAWEQQDIRRDYEKYFYRNAVTQQYSLNLSGGGSKHSFMVSGGLVRGLSEMVNSDNRRMNLRSLLSFRPFNNLEVSAEMSLLSTQSNLGVSYGNPITVGGGMGSIWPYARLVDDHGKALAVPMTYNPDYIDTLGGGRYLDWRLRPYDELFSSNKDDRALHNNILVKIGYKPVKNLELSIIYKHERLNGTSEFLKSEEAYSTRNLINRFTQLNGDKTTYIVPRGNVLEFQNSRMRGNNIRGQLSYNLSWGGVHRIDFIGGGETSDNISNSTSTNYYGYDPDLKIAGVVDYVNFYPISDGVSSTGKISSGQAFNELHDRSVSFFSNLSYAYKSRYILTASARRDAANIFGVSTNNKWKPLWSGGLAWILSRERFMEPSAFDNLKLRVTYGHSGNSGGMSAKTKIIMYNSVSEYTNTPVGLVMGPPNPNLRWELVGMFNSGVDFSLWNRRLSGSLEYFSKKSSDLISSAMVDPTNGFAQLDKNVAILTGKGVNIQVNADLLRRAVRWSVAWSFSNVKDVVHKYYGSAYRPDFLAGAKGVSMFPMEGHQLYPVFSYRSAGLNPENGNPRGYIGDRISDDYVNIFRGSLSELVYHGSAMPRMYGFLRHDVSWRGLALSINFNYKFDYYFQRNVLNYSQLFQNYQGHPDFDKRWQQPGDERNTGVPSLIYPVVSNRESFYERSEENIRRGDQIKLRDVRLSYGWPLKVGSAGKAMRMQVYGTMGNVALLWTANEERLDADYTETPPGRNYSLGVSVNF
ncbi:SusC/RagA family TonB-linked outer membrane protein [Chitinophaga lutea]